MVPSASGTFQPLRHRSGTMRERLHSYTKRTLGAGGSINEAVALPPGESCAGWVAVHAIDFYNDVSTIWAVMAADPYLQTFGPGEGFPSGVEYRWSDGSHEPAVPVSAPIYIEKVLGWIAEQMNDETKFPDDDNEAEALRVFQTPAFAALCGQIFRRIFRVYGIIYSSFFGTLEALDMAPHLNTCFKHFMFFCTEFGLLPEREMEPLEVLVKPIRKQYYAAKQQHQQQQQPPLPPPPSTSNNHTTAATNNTSNNNNPSSSSHTAGAVAAAASSGVAATSSLPSSSSSSSTKAASVNGGKSGSK